MTNSDLKRNAERYISYSQSRGELAKRGLVKLTLYYDSMLNIAIQSVTADLIRKAKVIVWDEAPMNHRFLLEALDRTLRDITRNKLEPFGGKVVVLADDFRQVLPVIINGSRAQIVAASIKRSPLWQCFQFLSLTENMRVAKNGSDDNLRSFDQWLLRLGNGTLPHVVPGSEMIWISVEKCITINANSKALRQQGMREVINFVFPNLTARFTDRQWLSERTILAPKNTAVDEINNFLISRLRGEEIICKSADSTVDLDDATHYTKEYLNTINSSGMPAHRIVLKINCPLILLCNLNPSEGLCNGTRLILNKSLGNFLHCTIVGGTVDGREVSIPRITLKPNEEEGHPVEWQRRQFPVRAAFAMPINKSQG